MTTTADYRVDDIVREVVCDIGYDRAKYGFDGHTCAVLTAMHGQSPISPWALTTRWKDAVWAIWTSAPAIRA